MKDKLFCMCTCMRLQFKIVKATVSYRFDLEISKFRPH